MSYTVATIPSDIEAKELLEILPGVLEDDTNNNNKGGYVIIVPLLQQIKDNYGNDSDKLAYFLAALAKTTAVMSEQIYEHYRGVVDLYKLTLKEVIAAGNLSALSAEAKSNILSSMKDAIAQKYLNEEKYVSVMEELA